MTTDASGDTLPPKDADQFKWDAAFVAGVLYASKHNMSEAGWATVRRFWRYLEADAFLPPELV